MISFDDISPASDNATHKMFGIHPDWTALFAGNDVNAAWPLLLSVKAKMPSPRYDLDAVLRCFSEVYTEAIQQNFLDRKLRKLGYQSVEQFRKEGQADLGDDFFELRRELDQSEIGVQFIVGGFDSKQSPSLFEVDSPGHAKSRELLRYAVIGSGYHMAMASLRRKQLDGSLPSTIYRVLEAKFSSETASGVGKRTTVFLKSRNGHMLIGEETTQKIRGIWEDLNNSPDPIHAIELIKSKLSESSNSSC